MICRVKGIFTQPQEHDADALALKLVSGAGYDAQSYLRFLQRLKTLEGSASGGRLMSTHPGVSSRIGRVSDQLRTIKPGGATLANRYAAMVAK